MRNTSVYQEFKAAQALVTAESKKTRQHVTETVGHAANINHQDHEKTRKHVTETAGRGVDLLGRKIDATGDALGAKIDKIGWAGKTVGWIIFELIVAVGLFALAAWFFGTHCLIPTYDANWTLVGMIRDWHTWIIAVGVPVVWLIVAHWLIPAGRKQSK